MGWEEKGLREKRDWERGLRLIYFFSPFSKNQRWLVHDLYKAFPNRKDDCILILGINKLGQRVSLAAIKGGFAFLRGRQVYLSLVLFFFAHFLIGQVATCKSRKMSCTRTGTIEL